MKENRLISMVAFVDEVITADRPCDRGAMLDEIAEYSTFLQKPLTLGMFIPCDEDGNVLEEPTKHHDNTSVSHKGAITDEWKSWHREYQQAKEHVLFEINLEGLSGIKHNIKQNRTVEYLTPFNLTLTPNALKQF